MYTLLLGMFIDNSMVFVPTSNYILNMLDTIIGSVLCMLNNANHIDNTHHVYLFYDMLYM